MSDTQGWRRGRTPRSSTLPLSSIALFMCRCSDMCYLSRCASMRFCLHACDRQSWPCWYKTLIRPLRCLSCMTVWLSNHRTPLLDTGLACFTLGQATGGTHDAPNGPSGLSRGGGVREWKGLWVSGGVSGRGLDCLGGVSGRCWGVWGTWVGGCLGAWGREWEGVWVSGDVSGRVFGRLGTWVGGCLGVWGQWEGMGCEWEGLWMCWQ